MTSAEMRVEALATMRVAPSRGSLGDDKAGREPYTGPRRQRRPQDFALLDIKWIRDHQDAFVKGLEARGFEPRPRELLTRILKLDEERRGTIQQLQEAQARRNAASKEIGKAKQAKDEAGAKRLMDEVASLKATIQDGEAGEKRLDQELLDLLAAIPNIPAADVPVGSDESANVELRKVGTPREFDFLPKQHFELGEDLGLMDFETAAKLSGSRFVVLKGPLARLERALAQFMLDLHTEHHGYTEIDPPLMVYDDVMFGTGQLPKFADDQFLSLNKREYLAAATWAEVFNRARQEGIDPEAPNNRKRLSELFDEELSKQPGYQRRWLIPTAEVPLTNLVREDITEESKLPLRVTAWTPCFRAEAGAAGKDTRGMIRQHQFQKVELVSVTTPEQSAAEHERMTACAETVLKRLGLPYRVVVLSTGDMGFAAEKTYDIEVWLPGQGAYREISSCSNCGDFQARRMNARYRPANAKDNRFVHTLNGSGVAVGRALIAVMENYQEADGSIAVPEALKPYMGGIDKIERPS
jgi:seryl-tRNA synthetase